MSFQYLHTSAKRGLEPGKSGFCCVARDRQLPPDLIAELESQSRYSTDAQGGCPMVMRHRIARLRSGVYHILSRIRESGTDYSKRNNHLAHHIIFPEEETPKLPNPAAILLNWRGWRSTWNEPPRILEDYEAFNLQDIETFWKTHNTQHGFPPLTSQGSLYSRVFKIHLHEERKLVDHLRRSLNELPASERWNQPFTSCLLPTDQPQDYSWAGLLFDLNLPYEVNLTPRRLDKEGPSPSKREKLTLQKTETTTTPEEISETSDAPVVEIPEEYDRKKRKRPKRAFGHRELRRSINWAIAIGSLLCLALIALFYQFHQKSHLSQPERSFTTLRLAAEKQWSLFQEAGYPQSQIAEVEIHAQTLSEAGLDEPEQVLEFLRTLAEASSESPELEVPDSLIQFDEQGASLPLSPVSYPSLRRLALIPTALLPSIQQLDTHPGHSMAIGPLSTLDATRFTASEFADSIEAYQLQNPDELQLSPQAQQRIKAYQDAARALQDNSAFSEILQLPNHLPRKSAPGFIQFDLNGRLKTDTSPRLSAYLRETFLEQVEISSEPALQTTLFQAELSLLRQDARANAHEVSRHITEALDSLPLSNRAPSDPWRRLNEYWRKAFHRDDLMEQTILNYTMDALETERNQLLELQNRITPQDWNAHLLAKQQESQTRELQQLARELSDSKEWVVIGKQSAKVRASLP